MTTKSTTVRLSGLIKLAPVQSNAYVDFVNSTTMDLALETDEITVENATGGGGNDDIDRKVKSLKLSVSARRVSVDLLELALGGAATKVATGAVTAETHVVEALGAEIILNNLRDRTVALVVTPDGGGTPLVAGEDYEITQFGIRPLEGGDIAVDDEISVAYTKAAQVKVEALLNLAAERGVFIAAKNERTGADWAGKFHRVSFSPAKNLKFYDGNQFASFDLEAEVLIADWITGDNLSRYYQLLVGDAL